MLSKLSKNMERITEELKAWGSEMLSIIKRFQYVTLPFMKSRVPLDLQEDGFPDNNEFFHLCTAFIEETIDKLPRTLAYSIIIYGVVRLCLLIL